MMKSVLQVETAEEVESEEEALVTETLTADPSCPLPDVSENILHVSLLDPSKGQNATESGPLLVYVPGMDCTGQGIRRQLPGLYAAGYARTHFSSFRISAMSIAHLV